MKRLMIFALIVLLAVAAAAQEETMPADLSIFDYEASAVTITENGSETRDGVVIRDIAFESPVDGMAINAYLIAQESEAEADSLVPILYVHWYEPQSPTSNRTQFIEEAVMMAREHGVIALLPEVNWEEPTWYRGGRSLDTDYNDSVRQVINLRRALDVLMAQPGADPERLAVVGHDFGGMYASPLAAADRRARAYVIIAAASDFNNWMLFGVPETQPGLDGYKAQMQPLAPIHFVADAAPASILFQMGTEDFYTPEADYQAFFEAASEPKQLLTYDTEHAMDLSEIQADRVAFLVEELGLE